MLTWRFRPGPVFVYESITAARRWQVYALRSFTVLGLLLGLCAVWLSFYGATRRGLAAGSIHEIAELGRQYYNAIALVEISVVLLVAPAATAGAICLDRARGSLTHLMLTDLTDAEIVLGKLCAGLAPVVALVAASVPVLAFCTLLGGVDLDQVIWLSALCLALAVFGSALALAVSARASKPHEVLMAVYTVWVVVILGPLVWWVLASFRLSSFPPYWLYFLDPYYLALTPPGDLGLVDWLLTIGGMFTASAVFVGYAIWRLRSDPVEASLRRKPRRWARWWPGPSLDRNPVLWREWRRIRPSRIARLAWGLFIISSILGSAFGIRMALADLNGPGLESVGLIYALQVGFGLLLVSAIAPSALAEERVRGHLDVLMTTPLSTASIVIAKWWAIYRIVLWLTILPTIGHMVIALGIPNPIPRGGRSLSSFAPLSIVDRIFLVVLPTACILIHGAAWTSLGLALATWFRRVGRAIAVSVSLYVTVTVGGFILLELGLMSGLANYFGFTFQNNGSTNMAVNSILISLDPPLTQLTPLFEIIAGDKRHFLILGHLVMMALVLACAGILFGLTLLTFNRCLGRSPERPRRPPKPPRRKPHGRSVNLSDTLPLQVP